MDDIKPLTYQPLGPNSIRLFQLNNDVQSNLSGKLKCFALDTSPPYYALSYCWGSQPDDTPIEINGEVFYVNQSLSHALYQIPTTSKKSSISIKWMWIDRICINQKHITERSEQLRLMGSIFKKSIRTIIWLGNDSDSSSAAWDLIDQIYNIFKKQYPEAQVLSDVPFKLYSESEFAASGLPGWDNAQWNYFRKLLELPWFTRTWVIQEVALSQEDPIIFHGQCQYPWYRLSWAAAWLRRSGYVRLSHIPSQLLNVDSISCIRRSQSPWPLDALLVFTSLKFQATDQRDKVYGLLGLAREMQDASNIPDALLPDYELDVTETYQKVAQYILSQYQNLSTLTRTSTLGEGLHQKQQKYTLNELPSWVPNWCDFNVVERNIQKSLSWISHSDTTDLGVLGFPDHCNASAGLPLQIHQSNHFSTIRLSGLWMDTVAIAVWFNYEIKTITWDSYDCQTLCLWKAAAALISVYSPMNWIVSYIKTTTAGHHHLGGRTEEELVKDGSAYLLEFLSRHECLKTSLVNTESMAELMNTLQDLSIGGDAKNYVAMSLNFCFQRSFFITSEGRMGIGPPKTQPEDKVAVLLGGGVTYILREQESSWSLIGESYVDGLMKGEGIQRMQAGELPLSVIELR